MSANAQQAGTMSHQQNNVPLVWLMGVSYVIMTGHYSKVSVRYVKLGKSESAILQDCMDVRTLLFVRMSASTLAQLINPVLHALLIVPHAQASPHVLNVNLATS